MKTVQQLLICALLAALTALAAYAILLLEAARATLTALPSGIAATRAALVGEVACARTELLSLADRQLTTLQTSANAQIAGFRQTADRRLGDSLERVDRALVSVEGLRSDLKPILANTARITARTDEAAAVLFQRDALPAQALGLIAAAKVTAGETAQTIRTVRDAAPKLAVSAESVGSSAAGIARDTHSITASLAKPKNFWGKVGVWLETAGKIGARFL